MSRGGSAHHLPQGLLRFLARPFGNRHDCPALEPPQAPPSERDDSAVVGPGHAFETVPGVKPAAERSQNLRRTAPASGYGLRSTSTSPRYPRSSRVLAIQAVRAASATVAASPVPTMNMAVPIGDRICLKSGTPRSLQDIDRKTILTASPDDRRARRRDVASAQPIGGPTHRQAWPATSPPLSSPPHRVHGRRTPNCAIYS